MNWQGPQVGELPGGRLHLQHGPIDLVIKAESDADSLRKAYAAATLRFQTVLGQLAAELPLLRCPLTGETLPLAASPVARRMIAACWPHRARFITPMAAVAGAVADEIRDVMLESASLRTLYVNNGGDIAVHVAPGENLRIGVVPDPGTPTQMGQITVDSGSGIGGIATSGWRGRSFSLGVADAVTVVAPSAAAADAAATMIANAVSVNHSAVRRAPAFSLDPDSDLGDLAVTVGVDALPTSLRREALDAGLHHAQGLASARLILGAVLTLRGETRICGPKAGYLERLDS